MQYDETTLALRPGDQIVFYTDGITEATAPDGRRCSALERLDEALENCHLDADGLIRAVLDAVEEFTRRRPDRRPHAARRQGLLRLARFHDTRGTRGTLPSTRGRSGGSAG